MMKPVERSVKTFFWTLKNNQSPAKVHMYARKVTKTLNMACILNTMRPKLGTSQKVTFNFLKLADNIVLASALLKY